MKCIEGLVWLSYNKITTYEKKPWHLRVELVYTVNRGSTSRPKEQTPNYLFTGFQLRNHIQLQVFGDHNPVALPQISVT